MTTQTLTQKKKKTKRLLYFKMPKHSDLWINISLLVLAIFGLLMIASASMGIAVDNPIYLPFTIAKQIVFLVVGYFAMCFLANRFDFDFLTSDSFLVCELGMLLLLLFALAFPAAGGSRAWIRLPIASMDISIQPSEFSKIVLILIVAAYVGDIHGNFKNPRAIWQRPVFFIAAYLIIVLVFQRDLGSMAVMTMISFVCMMIPTHPQLRRFQKTMTFLFYLGVVAAIFLLSPIGEGLIRLLPLQDYQINRILSSVDPFTDEYNAGYQLVNGLVSFATGGWFGLGFGNSVRKYTRFPAANTDFILAIIVEELGMVGFLIVFVPYMIIVCRLFHYAFKMKSERGKIICVGVAMYIVIHCLFNIGGVTGLIPLTGVPLLMISAGGSSAWALMMAVGIAQAVIHRYNRGEIQ